MAVSAVLSVSGKDGQVVTLRDQASASAPHLWPGVSGHQALQLQRGPLPDGEHPLSVALLRQAARLLGVGDADTRGRCRGAGRSVKDKPQPHTHTQVCK